MFDRFHLGFFFINSKNNLLDTLDIESIDNKKIRSKRKLVLDILSNEEKGKSAEDLMNETKISKSIINNMLKQGLIKEEFVEVENIVPIELFQENKIENHKVKLLKMVW
jgi:primosomal protein N'